MTIFRERSDLPIGPGPNLVGYGNGRSLPHDLDSLSGHCERLGLTRLDHFVVDHDSRLEQALEERGWVRVDSVRHEVEIPHPDFNNAGITVSRRDERGKWRHFAVSDRETPESLASQRQYAQIEAEVERTTSWFDPEDGLRTVRGLIEFLESCEHPLRAIELGDEWYRDNRKREFLPGAELVDSDWDDDEIDPGLDHDERLAVPDLIALEFHLESISRMKDRFHLGLSE